MKFSERYGYKKIEDKLQVEAIKPETRNRLWNILYIKFDGINLDLDGLEWSSETENFRNKVLHEYFKKPIDDQPHEFTNYIKEYFFSCEWNEVFDLLEFILNHFNKDKTLSISIKS